MSEIVKSESPNQEIQRHSKRYRFFLYASAASASLRLSISAGSFFLSDTVMPLNSLSDSPADSLHQHRQTGTAVATLDTPALPPSFVSSNEADRGT